MTVGPRKETWRPAEPEPDGPRHSAEVGSDGLRVVLGEGLGTPEGRLVSLAGELDAMAAPHLLVILEHVLRDRTQPSGASELRGQRGSLHLDLRALSFIDCGGLRALQRAANLAESVVVAHTTHYRPAARPAGSTRRGGRPAMRARRMKGTISPHQLRSSLNEWSRALVWPPRGIAVVSVPWSRCQRVDGEVPSKPSALARSTACARRWTPSLSYT
jgi:hypothetical protein